MAAPGAPMQNLPAHLVNQTVGGGMAIQHKGYGFAEYESPEACDAAMKRFHVFDLYSMFSTQPRRMVVES